MKCLNLKDLFNGMDDVEERINQNSLYDMELEGNFSKLNDSKINEDFAIELFNILPKNILTMGYKCTTCETWICDIKSLCNTCMHNFLENEVLEDYHSKIVNHKLLLSFSTEDSIDLENIKLNFLEGEYIKSISINKVDIDDDTFACQHNVIIYNDIKYVVDSF